MTCSSIYGIGIIMRFLHFVYIGHEFITSKLVPRVLSAFQSKMAAHAVHRKLGFLLNLKA